LLLPGVSTEHQQHANAPTPKPNLDTDTPHPHQATNGYPAPGGYAIAILPRWATGITYTASTLQEALYQSNQDAAAAAPSARVAPMSSEALLRSEATRVVRDALLPLRADPHMFHQANLRVLGSGGGGSLVMMWVEAVTNALAAIVEWPVRSLKLDDLSQLYLERQARADCKLTYRLVVGRGGGGSGGSSGALQAVTVSSGAAAGGAGGAGAMCTAPLLMRPGVDLEGKGGTKVPVSVVDGVRTLSVRVPVGGSVTLQVVGSPAPWLTPRL